MHESVSFLRVTSEAQHLAAGRVVSVILQGQVIGVAVPLSPWWSWVHRSRLAYLTSPLRPVQRETGQIELWSITDLLEKLVNGFPLVRGSTFEQVEDKTRSAPGPGPDCMVCTRQGCSRLPPPPPLHPP